MRSMSFLFKFVEAVIVIFCSLPVALSFAVTCRMPFASISKVTSTCGIPRGATLIYLGARLQSFRDGEVPLVIQETSPKLMDVSSQAEAARRILSQPLTITLPNYREGDPGPWTFDIPVLANMLAVTVVENGGVTEMQVGLNP